MTDLTNHLHPASATIPAMDGRAHVVELLRSLPELARQQVAATARFEACLQLLTFHVTRASLDVEAIAGLNSVRPVQQSAKAAVQRRSARAMDATADNIMPNPRARQPRRFSRAPLTREERLRRQEEKHQRELAECRARSVERHREHRRQVAEKRRLRASRDGANGSPLPTGDSDVAG